MLIGVLIDDLVTASRGLSHVQAAQYRLMLRHGADLRLTELAGASVWSTTAAGSSRVGVTIGHCRPPHAHTRHERFLFRHCVEPRQLGSTCILLTRRSRGGLYGGVITIGGVDGFGRQRIIERFRRMEEKRIPAELDYRSIPQLRAEAREKFERVRPASVGQAGRISGVSPADIATLVIHLKRREPETSS